MNSLLRFIGLALAVASQVGYASFDYIEASIWQDNNFAIEVNGVALVNREPFILQITHPKGTVVNFNIGNGVNDNVVQGEFTNYPYFMGKLADAGQSMINNEHVNDFRSTVRPDALLSSFLITPDDLQNLGNQGYVTVSVPNNSSLSERFKFRLNGYSNCDNSNLTGRDISQFASIQDVYDYASEWLSYEQCFSDQFAQDDLVGLLHNVYADSCVPKVYVVFDETSLISERRWRDLISICDEGRLYRFERLMDELFIQMSAYTKRNNEDFSLLQKEQRLWEEFYQYSCNRKERYGGNFEISLDCRQDEVNFRILNLFEYLANDYISSLSDLLREHDIVVEELAR